MSSQKHTMFCAAFHAACAVLTAEFLTFRFAAQKFQPSALWILRSFLDSAAQSQGTALFIGFLAFYWLARRTAAAKPAGIRIFHAVMSLLFAASVCLGRSYSLLKNWDLLFGGIGPACLAAFFFAAAADASYHAFSFFDSLLCAEVPLPVQKYRKYRRPLPPVSGAADAVSPPEKPAGAVSAGVRNAACAPSPLPSPFPDVASAAGSASGVTSPVPAAETEEAQKKLHADKTVPPEMPRQKSPGALFRRFFQTRFCRFFAAFFAAGLLYLLVFFPGSGTADTLYQFSQWLGVMPMNSRHPLPSTLLMGTFLSFGTFLGNQNIGVFFYNLLQVLFQSFVFAQCTETVCRLTQSRTLRWSAFLWLLLNPLFPSWGITCVKDTVFYIGVLWLITCLVRIRAGLCTSGSRISMQLTAAALIVAAFRLNGIITAAASLVISAVCLRRRRSDALRVLGAAALVLTSAAGLLWAMKSADIGLPWREAFSLPLQQTARVVWAGRELREADRSELNRLFHGRDLRRIYDPELAAPVKWAWGEADVPFSDWRRFLQIWRRLGKQYPADYVQAAFGGSWRYLFPGAPAVEDQSGLPDFIPHERLHGIRLYLNRTGWPAAQNIILLWHTAVKSLPVTGLVYSCAFYVWTVLFLTGTALFRKKYAVLLPASPLLLTIAACFAAPISGCLRYLLPAAAALPLLLVCVLLELHPPVQGAEDKKEAAAPDSPAAQ